MSRLSHIPHRTLAAWSGQVVLLAVGAFVDPGLTLTMAPALLMLAMFAVGIRPGERLIINRVRERLQPRPPRPFSSPRPRLTLVVRPSGLDLASALAMRPPPPTSVTA